MTGEEDRAAPAVVGVLLEAVGQPACLTDPEGRIRRANRAFLRLAGLDGATAPPLAGRPLAALLDADLPGAARGRLTGRDGVARPVALRVTTADGGLVVFVRDLTGAVAAETEPPVPPTPTGAWSLDPAKGRVVASPAARAARGLPDAGPLTCETMAAGQPEAFRDGLGAALDHIAATGEGFDRDLPAGPDDGARRWVRVTAAGGDDGLVRGTLRDVTAERACIEHGRRLGRIVETTTTSIVLCDAYGLIVWVNGAFTMLTGFGPEEALGRNPGRLLQCERTDPATIARVRAALAAGQGIACEILNRARDGRDYWIAMEIRALRDRRGRLEGFFGLQTDITARKVAEARLVEARAEARAAGMKLSSAVEVLPDGFVLYDAEDRLVLCNGRYRALYAASAPAMLPGERFEDILRHGLAAGEYPDAEGDEAGWLARRMAMHREPRAQFEQRLRGGRWIRVVEEATPDGGRVGLRIDITEMKAQQRALELARERAEAANRTKSLFLANMSHEIRTPMNGVMGMAEALEAALTDPAHRQMIAAIRESGETLLNIINDILDFSKIEAGKLELEHVDFLPCDLARKIESLHTLKAAEKHVSLSVMTTRGADTARRGDPHRILQVLHNLVSNAIKFTEEGEVTVTLRCTPTRPLVLEVRDTGVGMTEAQVARVFEDFAQADSSTTRRFGGTGLGMSIVKRLVEAMQGTVELSSRPGEGTCVRVALPLEQAEPAPAPPAPAAGPLPAGLCVLAADDNRTNRIVLEAMLARLGIAVRMVPGGAEAVAAVGEARHDLLLLDISMPGMDGIETLAAIRERERALGLAPVPAIAVTANALSHQVEAYLASGFAAHVAKPIRTERLVEAMAQCLAPGGRPAGALQN